MDIQRLSREANERRARGRWHHKARDWPNRLARRDDCNQVNLTDIPPPPTRRCPEGPAADAAAGHQLAVPAPGAAASHGASEHVVPMGCRHTACHSRPATPQQLAEAQYRQMPFWDWANVLSSKNFHNADSIYQHLVDDANNWLLLRKTARGPYAEKWVMAVCKNCHRAVVADLRLDALESSEEKLDGFFGLTTLPRDVRKRCIYETMHPHSCALLNPAHPPSPVTMDTLLAMKDMPPPPPTPPPTTSRPPPISEKASEFVE